MVGPIASRAATGVLLGLAASVLGSAASVAPPAQAEEKAQPIWVSSITHADYDSRFPAAALESRVSGDVALTCTIDSEGVLSCSVVSEEPGGWGFGDAALALADVLRAGPEMSDGRPSASEVVDLQFRSSPGPE